MDVFVPSIPFHDEARARRVRVRIGGREMWILSAESIAVFKLLFFRDKDRTDLSDLVAARAGDLDRALVRRTVAGMMGEGDERVQFWDRLTPT